MPPLRERLHSMDKAAAIRTILDVNGERVEVEVSILATLAETLRDLLKLTGTKISCNAGDCGACSVLIGDNLVASCQVLVATVSGRITTIEGISGKVADALRSAFIEEGAFQCGFCTSGQLIACFGLVEKSNLLSDQQLGAALNGNICRCTGYAAIIRAIRSAARKCSADR